MTARQFEARLKKVDGRTVDVIIGVTLSYDPDTDPYAVQAVFMAPGEDVRTWHFARDLLDKGSRSSTPYGSGDVKFRYTPQGFGVILMCLRSPDGHADVALPAMPVWQFLADTRQKAEAAGEDCGTLVDEFLKELFEA